MQDQALTFEKAVAELMPSLRWDARKLRLASPTAVGEDDLIQEALLGAFLMWGKLLTTASPIAAMRQKCRWAMIDHLRATRWGGRFGGGSEHVQFDDDYEQPGEDPVTPENHLHAKDLARLLVKACKDRPQYLRALELRAEGQTTTEIAQTMGLSESRISQFFTQMKAAVC